MEQQKEVKIIGLKINDQFGILQSFECKFDNESNLIVIKGEVGSGKTTLRKSLSLGTLGSDTLKDDKSLYGKINQEVQLLDGEIPIFVGCKSNEKGKLDYVIYIKDAEGKIVKDPVIDGVKVTPVSYLKNLQTALTWRMDELTSENATVQKKLLLELYKTDLARVGVIYDKSDLGYTDSILGRIDQAETERAQKDYQRKEVGGFRKHLEPLGIDVDKPETFPQRKVLAELENQNNKLKYDLDNISSKKRQRLDDIELKVKAVYVGLRETNEKIRKENDIIEEEFNTKHRQYVDARMFKDRIDGDLVALKNNDALTEENLIYLTKMINETVKLAEPARAELKHLIEFDDDEKCITIELPGNIEANNLFIELKGHKETFKKIVNEEDSEGKAKIEKEIETVSDKIKLALEHNKICTAIDAFIEWRDVDKQVAELKQEYAKKLASINTGVDGLRIEFIDNEGKLDIYLTYNGAYDTKYFNNKQLEARKLSSYSGTQKPLICLLLQNYLLSKKPKAMRYLWIDNIPIDNKTKLLLYKMGEDLNLTIFISITGDFNREGLDAGDILIEGGEVFFNKK